MFEDQTVELLPARTTMKAMGWMRGARPVSITLNVFIQQTIIQQFSFGSGSPNTAVIIIGNG